MVHHELEFAALLLPWFEDNKRSFPWRDTPTAYQIAVAEALLQKTAAANALSVYNVFIERFPTVFDLAWTQLDEIQELLRPLGLPARTHRLHELALRIVNGYEGAFPRTERELRSLPGVGHYGAAAIASIAFGQVVPMIDINVMRILHRVFSIPFTPRNAPSRYLKEFTLKLMPVDAPKEFNLGLVDLGALLCRPRQPKCDICPLLPICNYGQQNSSERS